MNKQDMLRTQQCVLRLNVHCDGCKHKIRKKLQKIEGVFKVSVDVEQGKVTVSGDVDPATLIAKLEKSGKHAELWRPQKGPVSFANNEFKNIQFKNSYDAGKDGKDHKRVGMFQAPAPQAKGSKDVKFMTKDQKSVKFNLPEDEDDDDDYEDEFDSDEFDEELGDYHKPPTKVAPRSGKATPKGGHKGDTRAKNDEEMGKKRSGIDMFLKGILGRSGSQKYSGKAGSQKEIGKNSGKNVKAGKGEGKTKTSAVNGKDANHNVHAGAKTNDSWGGKKFDGGRKLEGKPQHVFHESNENHKGGGVWNSGGGLMGQHTGNFQAVQGLPTGQGTNVGHLRGLGQNDLYNQQYMAHMMMMNQQRGQNGHDAVYHPSAYVRPQPGHDAVYHPPAYVRPQPGHDAVYHPSAYVRPQPAMTYGPYGQPHVTDQYTHIFSDENASGCSIM